VKARLKKVANELGLPLGDRKKTYNSRLAQELGKWAESQGKGDAFHNAVFRAYFVDGKNIAKIPLLVDVAKSLDFSGSDAQKVLETRSFKEAVDSDVGAQPYETLEQLMKVSNTKERDSAL
jgi:predicted DsbA family dithiol-disulfide isomerase